MSREPRIPPELEQVDRALRGVSFRPRASLGPEVLGRLHRGEPLADDVAPRPGRPALFAVAAALLLVVGAAFLIRAPGAVAVDRCCYDLDGGKDADDGVLVLAGRDSKVHQLRIYEDRDDSGGFTPSDLVRLDRGDSPALHQSAVAGLVTMEHCCLDFDGGGPADDGLLVLGVPPDRVVMAAIYERPAGTEARPVGAGGFLLR